MPVIQVRISCAGFPTKMLHEDFVDHFWNLAPQLLARTDLDDAAIGKAIADQCHLAGYQSGKTKVSGPPVFTDCIEKAHQC